MLKTVLLITALLATLSSCSDSQVYVFNDWTKQNLKNKPKYLLESSSFTPNGLMSESDSIKEWWLEQPIKEWFTYYEYNYNEDGFIVSLERQSQNVDSIFGKKITTREVNDDSIIITTRYENIPGTHHDEVYILNEHGLPFKKIVNHMNRLSAVDSFIRDGHNKIIEIYSKTFGIDDYSESSTQLSLNDFGDPIKEIYNGMTVMFNTGDTLYSIDTVQYKYIYDGYDNWILKAVIYDNIIFALVQRTIKY